MPSRHETTSCALCDEVIRMMDRAYASEGPDEPDLGLNVAYVTARRSLQRMASAEGWELPQTTIDAVRAKLHVIATSRGPRHLECELLSVPRWVLKLVDRRQVGRQVIGTTPRRRAGDEWLRFPEPAQHR
jgi:hypothetical protein